MPKGKESIAEYNSPFADRLRNLMDGKYGHAKISMIELAERIGATRQAISQYRNGTVAPNIDKVCLIAGYFEVTTDFLLGLSDTPHAEHVNAVELTGLSPKAIANLANWNETETAKIATIEFRAALNALITHGNGLKLLENLCKYLFNSYYLETKDENTGETEYNINFPITTVNEIDGHTMEGLTIFDFADISEMLYVKLQHNILDLKRETQDQSKDNKGGDKNGNGKKEDT